MRFLTVVERELRVAARRPAVRRSRIFCAVVGIALVSWFLLFPHFNSPRQFGQFLFNTLSVVAFIIAGLSGFATTSDCLSEEKREGTLGLLFLTELKGSDVIIGKLVASSLGVFYGLLAILPVIAISILAGGVSGGDFGRVVLTALNLLFLSLSIGMATSVFYNQGAHSLTAAAVVFAGLMVGLPFGLFIADELFGWKGLEMYFLIPCPGYACLICLTNAVTSFANATQFYSSLATTHLLGWGCLLFAMLRVGKSWQDKSEPAATKARHREPRLNFLATARLRFRRALIDINPYLWRAARPHYRGLLVWTVLGFAFAIFAWGWLFRREYFRDIGSYMFMTFLLNTIVKVWVATEAPAPLAADRQAGALELLLVTPLSEEEITRGLRDALWKTFAIPVLSILILTALFIAHILSPNLGSYSDTVMVSWMMATGMLVLVMDCLALGRLGHARALRSKSESRAVVTSVFIVMALPWILYMAGVSGIGLLFAIGIRLDFLSSWQFMLAFWAFLSLAVDYFALAYSNNLLPGRLRQIASARFDAR